MAANESIIKIRGDATDAISAFQALAAATVKSYQATEKAADTFKELRDNQRAMAKTAKISGAMIKDLDKNINKYAKSTGASVKEIKKLKGGLRNINSSFGTASMRAHQFAMDLKGVGLAIRNSGKNLQFMGRSIMIGMLPFANAISKASSFARALEQAEIRFIKITGLTRGAGDDFEKLFGQFEKLSESFGVSRDLITDIATDFALVGMPISEVDTLVRASNELAILGQIDVGPAKEILTSTVFAMRNMATLRGETLSFNDAIKQATGQMYLFNIVNNNTAMAISDMADAIPKLVPITVQFGLTVTEAAGALAAMKASGVSAAEGTVALRTGLLRLTSLTKQADEKVEEARKTLKKFNFEAGVGIETLANFGQSLLSIRRELGDASAFDIVKNILGIRQTAKVQLFVMDMQAAENQIQVVTDAMRELGGQEVFGSQQVSNMTEFARASRVPSEGMKKAADELLKDSKKMENVTSQFLRSLIIQMSGVENAQKSSMEEMQKVLESDAFKMQQARTAMKNALTEIGGLVNRMVVDHILPIVNKWIDAFRAIPDGVKKIIVIIAALVASFGPLLYMLAIMKMAFGQTMQIMAGAVGRFFSGFTAAGRAATVAANEQAFSVEMLALAHKHSTAAIVQNTAAKAENLGVLSAAHGLHIKEAASKEMAALATQMDTVAAHANTVAHRENISVRAVNAFNKHIGRTAFGRGVAGAARMAMHPARSIRKGALGVKRFMYGARGGVMPFGAGGRAGAALHSRTVGNVRKFQMGRTIRKAHMATAPAWRGPMAAPGSIPGALGSGQFKRAGEMAKSRGMFSGLKKQATGFIGVIKKIGPLLKLMLSPIAMAKKILMFFNPWALAFTVLLGTIAAVWITIKNNWVTFRAAVEPGLEALRAAWDSIKSALGSVMDAVFQLFNRLSFGAKEGADQGTTLGKVFGAVFKGIALALQGIAGLFKLVAKAISLAMDVVTPVINFFLGQLTAVIEIVKAMVALFKGDFSQVWVHVKRAAGAALLGLVSMVDGVFNFIIDKLAWFVDRAASVVGWFNDSWADGLRAAAEGLRDFGTTAVDGMRDQIAELSGISAEELIGIRSSDVRSIGEELGGVLGSGVADGFEDEMEFAAPGMHQAINDAAKEGREAAETFADGFTSAFAKFVKEMEKAIRKMVGDAKALVLDAFDSQTESVVAAYDAQIDAINAVIKEEERLSKEVAYQTKRREQIRDMALRNDSYRRNRALAIYEGRIGDARQLDLKERKQKEDADKKLSDLDTKRNETLLDQQRQDTIERINEQKRAYQQLRDDMKTELDGVLEELTKFSPKNKAEWAQIVDDIDAEIVKLVGSEEAEGIMGKLRGEMGPNIFDSIVEDVTSGMRDVYNWTPAAMEGDGPFAWLFDEFDKVEEEFVAFETRIKGWKDRLEQALLGEQAGTQEALMMATKGLDKNIYGHIISGLTDPIRGPEYGSEFEARMAGAQNWANYLNESRVARAQEGAKGIPDYKSEFAARMGGAQNWADYLGGVVAGIPSWYTGSDWEPDYKYYGGAIKAQYGRYLGGFGSSMIPVMAHGGEFMMSAKATRRIGVGALNNMNSFGKLSGPNDAGGGVTNNSNSNITIHVDTFVGQREWFEKMMSDYNIHVAPSSERARGIEKRTVGSYTERNTRSRV